MRWKLAVVCVVVAALLVWSWQSGQERGARAAAATSENSNAREIVELSEFELGTNASQSARQVSAAAAPIDAHESSTWIVGRVAGVAPEHVTDVIVSADTGSAGGHLSTRPGADGEYAIDVTSLLAARRIESVWGRESRVVEQDCVDLSIEAAHDLYFSDRRDLQCSTAKSGGRLELRCDLGLRVGCWLTVIVEDPEHLEPRDYDLNVYAQRCIRNLGYANDQFPDEPENYVPMPIEHRELLPKPGPAVIDFQNSTCTIVGSAQCELRTAKEERVKLVLRSGLPQITGSISNCGSAPTGIDTDSRWEGVWVRARRRRPDHSVDTTRDERPALPASDQFSAKADSDGRFQLDVPDKGPWEIEPDLAPFGLALLPATPPVVVTAPASNVEIGRDLREIEVHVHDARGPLEDATIEWTSTDRPTGTPVVSSTRTDSDGVTRMVGESKTRVSIRVLRDGLPLSEPLELDTDSSECVHVHEVKVPARDTATLILRSDEEGLSPDFVNVVFDDWPSGQRRIARSVMFDGESLTVRDCPAGEFRVSMTGTSRYPSGGNYASRFICSDEIDVGLTAGEATELRIHFRRGGRIRLMPRTFGDGRVFFRLLDQNGRGVPTTTVIDDANGQTVDRDLPDPNTLALDDICCIRECLRPGRYTLMCDSPEFTFPPQLIEVRADEESLQCIPVVKR